MSTQVKMKKPDDVSDLWDMQTSASNFRDLTIKADDLIGQYEERIEKCQQQIADDTNSLRDVQQAKKDIGVWFGDNGKSDYEQRYMDFDEAVDKIAQALANKKLKRLGIMVDSTYEYWHEGRFDLLAIKKAIRSTGGWFDDTIPEDVPYLPIVLHKEVHEYLTEDNDE